jgi:AraC-like DNA-binding protein
VDDIVDRYGIGKRNLQKLFREYVGVTPKWVIQRHRLHEAARLDTAANDLSTLAFELGYADQAHFVRDLKAAVGRPPTSYLRS